MKAAWQLLLQPIRQAPALIVLAALIWLGALGLLVMHGSSESDAALSTVLMGLGTWVWHVGSGQTLRGLCRPESFLLPDFRRSLAVAGSLDAALWALLPALALWLAGTDDAWLIGGLLLLVASLGLAVGSGRRAALLLWLCLIVGSWLPQLSHRLVAFALASSWTLPLVLLAAAAVLAFTMRPLLRIGDREDERSPLENTGLGRFQAPAAEGGATRRGAIARWLGSRFDGTAQLALQRALVRYRQRPGSDARRLALIRSLLLPHDNPRALGLRLMLVAAAAALYFFALHQRHYFNPEAIGAYATMLAVSRFPQLGRGMLRMRPHLADLYLTLAPGSWAEFQRTLADALMILVPIGVLSALAYSVLGVALVHADEPVPILFTAALTTASASLVGLAVHLIGPEGMLGRGIVNILLLLGAMAVYWGGYRLVDVLGLLFGGGIAMVIELSFGLGVWIAAQREYQRRTPGFE